jgi:hypothetical protein
MASSQIPSSKEFVVSLGAASDDGTLGPDDDGSGATPTDRTMVVPLAEDADPRDSWRRLVDEFPSAAWVSPVVLDAGSEPHYPTGDVTVRFHAPLSWSYGPGTSSYPSRPRSGHAMRAKRTCRTSSTASSRTTASRQPG